MNISELYVKEQNTITKKKYRCGGGHRMEDWGNPGIKICIGGEEIESLCPRCLYVLLAEAVKNIGRIEEDV